MILVNLEGLGFARFDFENCRSFMGSCPPRAFGTYVTCLLSGVVLDLLFVFNKIGGLQGSSSETKELQEGWEPAIWHARLSGTLFRTMSLLSLTRRLCAMKGK